MTAIIVDDEVMARENLRMMLEEYCPQIDVIDTAENIVEAKEKITTNSPEVIFLDVRMPSGTEGFELLESLEDRNFQVVFVTAFKDYAIQALNANAIHYILKPIDIEDLKNAVEKLQQYSQAIEDDTNNLNIYQESVDNLTKQILSGEQKKITLYHSKGFKIVEISEVVRVEAKGNYSLFHFKKGDNYVDSKTLKLYEEMLSSHGFLRVHKSHLINMHELKEYKSQQGNIAVMSDGAEIPVSRNKLSEFLTTAKRL